MLSSKEFANGRICGFNRSDFLYARRGNNNFRNIFRPACPV